MAESPENVLSFASIKGGVGKTTIAIETASALSNFFGKRVLLVDGNFSAPNLSLYLDIEEELTLHHALSGIPLHNTIYEAHGIDVIPASIYPDTKADITKLKKILQKFKNRYDYIIIDSSPNYEELKPVVLASDQIFLITTPDHVTLETTLKAAHAAKQNQTPINGIIVNRIRNPKHEYNIKEIEEISNIPVIAKIKEDKKLAESINKRTPMTILSPSSQFSKEIKNMASALCGLPEQEQNILYKIIPRILHPKERINRDLLRSKYYESML